MRTYEALYIVMPDLEDDGIQTVDKAVQSLITENGGSIVRSEIWGKRKLAYTVKKQTEGTYMLVRFEADPDFIVKLEQYFRLSEAIFRYQVVHFDEHTLRIEAEQQRRREEDMRNLAASPSRRDDDDDDGPRRPRRRDDDDDRDDDRPRRPRRRDDDDDRDDDDRPRRPRRRDEDDD